MALIQSVDEFANGSQGRCDVFGLFKMNRNKVAKKATQGVLDGKDLSGLDLSGLNFVQASFRNARFQGANLSGCEFSQCEMQGADLTGTTLQGTEFSQCEMQGARMDQSAQTTASFSQTEIDGVQWVAAAAGAAAPAQPATGLIMDPDKYFFSDNRLPIAQQGADLMAPVIGGTVKSRDEGDELHITGQYQGRTVRLRISVTFGTTSIEMKAARDFDLEENLYLQYDKDAVQHAHESETRDEWDEDDNAEQKLFYSAHVFFEGDPDELRAMKTAFERLPQDLRNELVQLLESEGGHSRFGNSGDRVNLGVTAKMMLDRQSPAVLTRNLDLVLRLVQAMEANW